MKGSLIMRLVDITLLLLLSLMAAASFTTSGPEPPITYELTEEGILLFPMQIGIASDGTIYTQGGTPITLKELESLVDAWTAEIEFIADAQAPANRLLAIHAIITRLDRQAAFRVRQIHANSP